MRTSLHRHMPPADLERCALFVALGVALAIVAIALLKRNRSHSGMAVSPSLELVEPPYADVLERDVGAARCALPDDSAPCAADGPAAGCTYPIFFAGPNEYAVAPWVAGCDLSVADECRLEDAYDAANGGAALGAALDATHESGFASERLLDDMRRHYYAPRLTQGCTRRDYFGEPRLLSIRSNDGADEDESQEVFGRLRATPDADIRVGCELAQAQCEAGAGPLFEGYANCSKYADYAEVGVDVGPLVPPADGSIPGDYTVPYYGTRWDRSADQDYYGPEGPALHAPDVYSLTEPDHLPPC